MRIDGKFKHFQVKTVPQDANFMFCYLNLLRDFKRHDRRSMKLSRRK
ncbi:MAG TPA: hypothetical protein PKL97_09975 [Candidatus Omnitrophota bacterium]|nr:hypothetical protein [Candidatus Omnitrophota bacterium]